MLTERVLAGGGLAFQANSRAMSEEDYGREFLSLALSVKVRILEEGRAHRALVLHIPMASSPESYTNATRFGCGGFRCRLCGMPARALPTVEFRFGAEVAIPAQRMHACGPMGLQELTTYKWAFRRLPRAC